MLPSYPTPYQTIDLPASRERDIRITVKRLDQKHPEIPGNKWYKLHYNIKEAIRQGQRQILTFGGAYSNHIQATAAAAKLSGLKAIGVIRGEQITPPNPTLAYALAAGMELHYLSRTDYRQKTCALILDRLRQAYGDFYLIPEGGTNALAIRGAQEILEESDFGYDLICTSIGTGGTMTGLLAAAKASQKVMGFSALKGDFIHKEIQNLLRQYHIDPACTYENITGYHFGGYAKFTPELIQFMQSFTRKTGIPLDPIYTGKMMFGLVDLLQKNKIPEGTKILALHTGGLQGIKGFNLRNGTELAERMV